MASFPVTSKALNLALFSFLFLISTFSISATSYQFQVGGEGGWVKPAGNETESYNGWATKNRFHIGDTVYFKYQRDSVLVVDAEDYQKCITSNPISKFDDGNTAFQFDRPGFFYFISGQPGHCKSGQKLIIRVMHPSEVDPPESAPSPNSGRGGSGGGEGSDSGNRAPPGLGHSSAAKPSVASYFATALGGVFVILYLFM